MNIDASSGKASVKERFWEEIRKYALVSTYLFVCFSVLNMYESALLAEHGASGLSIGAALVKALVIGKFILIGEAVRLGDRRLGPTLLHRVAWKSLAFLALLIVFNLLEEIVVGVFHGQSISQSAAEWFDRSWIEITAPVLVMLLILIPLISLVEVKKALGDEEFRALF